MLAIAFAVLSIAFAVYQWVGVVKADRALRATWAEMTGTEITEPQMEALHKMARIERNKQRIA